MWTFCCGLFRSGSTLQYQIVKDLVEDFSLGNGIGFLEDKSTIEEMTLLKPLEVGQIKVVKNHTHKPEIEAFVQDGSAIVISVYRDIRDVVASFSRKYSQELNPTNIKHTCDEYLDNYYKWKKLDSVFWFKYEDFVHDIPQFIMDIASILNVKMSIEESIQRSNTYSIGAQLRKIEQFNSDDLVYVSDDICYDPVSRLHVNHISETKGKVGPYRTILSKENVLLIEEIAAHWLITQEYKLDNEEVDFLLPHKLHNIQSQLIAVQAELSQAQFDLLSVQSELDRTQAELIDTKFKLNEKQKHIERMEADISFMEGSKFWKLRTKWLRIKYWISLSFISDK